MRLACDDTRNISHPLTPLTTLFRWLTFRKGRRKLAGDGEYGALVVKAGARELDAPLPETRRRASHAHLPGSVGQPLGALRDVAEVSALSDHVNE